MNGSSGPTRHEKYQVLIVDAQPLVRDGLRQLINAQGDLECCGEAGTQATALDLITSQKPDLVTIDICLHNGDGLELLKKLRAQYPLLLTLIITQYDESIFAERALKAGARGYVMKDHDADEVLTAIRTVLKGQIYASPRVAVIALNKMSGLPARRGHPIHRLSDRELQVLQLLGAGLPNRKVAEKLFLSVKTVEAHPGKTSSTNSALPTRLNWFVLPPNGWPDRHRSGEFKAGFSLFLGSLGKSPLGKSWFQNSGRRPDCYPVLPCFNRLLDIF